MAVKKLLEGKKRPRKITREAVFDQIKIDVDAKLEKQKKYKNDDFVVGTSENKQPESPPEVSEKTPNSDSTKIEDFKNKTNASDIISMFN